MRTNIDIDDRLMKQAQRLSGLKTKRAVVEEALKMLVRIKRQSDVLKLAGKVKFWEEIERERDEANLDLGR
jgi:Arc/MetJ family transcription regulator